jgi:hypothetical protein
MNIIKSIAVPSLTIAGRMITDLENLITLWGGASGTGFGYCTPRLSEVASGYIVPTGKTFHAYGMRCDVRTAGLLYWGYCDNDLGVSSNNAPSNGVQPAAAPNACRTGLVLQSGQVNSQFEIDMTGFQVPAGKYLYTYNDNGAYIGSYRIFGYIR